MEQWDTFAVIVGATAASLLGLLFVAISIRLEVIARSAELRNRAAQILVLFGTVLFAAALLAAPSQTRLELGIELIVLAVAAALALTVLDRRAKAGAGTQAVARALDVVTPNTFSTLLVAASGIVLTTSCDAGFYVLVAAVRLVAPDQSDRLAGHARPPGLTTAGPGCRDANMRICALHLTCPLT